MHTITAGRPFGTARKDKMRQGRAFYTLEEEEIVMMGPTCRRGLLLGLAATMSFAVAAAAQSASQEVKQPSGTVQVATKSVAVGVGVTWGRGTLSFDGKDRAFTVKGLSLTDLGVGNTMVKGNVYELRRLEDFAGTYAPAAPDFTMGGSGPPWSSSYRGLVLRNQNGVVVQLWVVREGPHLRLIDNAVEVRLE